jgi:hypothetical protein
MARLIPVSYVLILHSAIDMNGCHSTLAPNRCRYDAVFHSKDNVSWDYVFTRDCQYIKQPGLVDHGCDGCKEKDKLNE